MVRVVENKKKQFLTIKNTISGRYHHLYYDKVTTHNIFALRGFDLIHTSYAHNFWRKR
jgi:hypothetical protein